MEKWSLGKKMQKNLSPISFLAFLIVLYVSRNALPYAIYPLIALLFLFTLYQFISFKHAKKTFVKSIKIFYPLILLIIIELAALCYTVDLFKGYPLDLFKNIAFISIFLFLLSSHVQNKSDFKLLLRSICQYFILFSIIVSILGLWKFFYSPHFLSYHNSVTGYTFFRWGSSIVSDYNFFSLFLLNGLIFGLYKILDSPEEIKHKMWFLVALQLILLTGILSGSRRFMFCLAVFFIICLLLLIPYLFKKVFSNSFSYKYLLVFLTFSLFNFGMTYSFLSYFPLITEKAEKVFCINAKKVNTNILSVSYRINSVASFRLIKVHTDNKITDLIEYKEIVSITSSRENLWALGKRLYCEYTVPQKTFGCGFTFLNIFKEKTERYLYPHHLFLSVLLFSGIAGLILYIAVLLWASIIYLFHLKDLKVLFFLFALNFIFGFFSFTDFFGATFYFLLLILPILYSYLYRSEKKLEVTT